jgi:hypothetical protein
MTRNPDPEVAAVLEEESVRQDLAQFEPDPDGIGSRDPGLEKSELEGHATAGAEQWIEWPDAADESVWAAAELRSFTGS